MKTREEVITPFLEEHAKLTRQYYQDEEITEEEFNELHGANWEAMDKALISEGITPVPVATGPSLEDRVSTLEAIIRGGQI